MFLKELELVNFKNHQKKHFSFTKKVICFTGLNGVGKTNILDAIYFSCIGKSYFSSTDKQCIRQEETFFRIVSTIEKQEKTDKIVAILQQGKRKKIEVNNVPYKKLIEHIGLFPIVTIAPDDNVLILGSAEERRKFIDRTLAQSDTNYLYILNQYNKTLAQRNALLKNAYEKQIDTSLLNIYNEQIIPLGKKINVARNQFIQEITPLFNHCYKAISGEKEKLSLTYKSQLNHEDFSLLIKQAFTKDTIMQRSTCGVHKDDILFMMNDEKIKTFGSQGQQKTFLLALKLSIFGYLKEKLELEPIFLIDDMFDKLDIERGNNLVKFVHDFLGQVFISHTDKESFKQQMKSISFQLIELKNE